MYSWPVDRLSPASSILKSVWCRNPWVAEFSFLHKANQNSAPPETDWVTPGANQPKKSPKSSRWELWWQFGRFFMWCCPHLQSDMLQSTSADGSWFFLKRAKNLHQPLSQRQVGESHQEPDSPKRVQTLQDGNSGDSLESSFCGDTFTCSLIYSNPHLHMDPDFWPGFPDFHDFPDFPLNLMHQTHHCTASGGWLEWQGVGVDSWLVWGYW